MTDVLSFATLLGAIAALVATAMSEDRALHRLAWLRIACAGTAAALVAAGLLDLVSGLALGVACLAFVLSVHSIWLAMRHPAPLQSSLHRLTAGDGAAWRDEFERPFAEYVRKHPAGASARDP
jgi:hypothetical protein